MGSLTIDFHSLCIACRGCECVFHSRCKDVFNDIMEDMLNIGYFLTLKQQVYALHFYPRRGRDGMATRQNILDGQY